MAVLKTEENKVHGMPDITAWVPDLLPLTLILSQHLPPSARDRLIISAVAQEFSDGQFTVRINKSI